MLSGKQFGRENGNKSEREALPPEGDLDGCGEAGGEEVGWEVGVHGQQLAGLTGSQLDAVLHRGRQWHLSERVAGVNGCDLNTHNGTGFAHIHQSPQGPPETGI